MKTILLISIVLVYDVFSMKAQETDQKKNRWNIGLTINTVEPITEAGYDIYFGQGRLFNDFDHQKINLTSFGINVSYIIKNHWEVRLLGRVTKYNVMETYNQKDLISSSTPSSDYIIDTGYVKQTTIVVAPGILWNFQYKILKLYGGVQIPYRIYNPADEHLIYRVYDTRMDTLLSHRYYDIKLDGGYSIGIGPVIGFSVNIFKGICVGGEFSSAYSYYNTGGKLNWTQTRIYPTAYIESITNKHTYQGYKFSSVIASFNLSYSF